MKSNPFDPMTQLKKGSLLHNLYLYTEGIESPPAYRVWTSLYGIASCLGRRVWSNFAQFQVFPNIYVILVGNSGVARKTTCMSIIRDKFLFDTCSYPFMSGKISSSKLLSNLAMKTEDNTVNIFSSELSTTLQSDSLGNDLVATLTDLYDCHRGTTQDTQRRGLESIVDPCINLMAATTKEWINLYMPISLIEGGFTSRVIFVVHLGKTPIQDWPELLPEQEKLERPIHEAFEKISKLPGGNFPILDCAKDYNRQWYRCFRTAVSPPPEKLASYYSRKQTHMIKIALLICVSEGEWSISVSHMRQANELLSWIEESMEFAYEGVGNFRSSILYDKILRILKENHGSCFHAHLMKKLYKYGTLKEVHGVIEMLVEGEHLFIDVLAKKKIYRLWTKKNNGKPLEANK